MSAKMTPFQYTSLSPPEYKCDTCCARGVRLYREYQTFAEHTGLTCTKCTPDYATKYNPQRPHEIGWWVAAVPTDDGLTFWPYTSVPQAGVEWWNALPVEATP